MYILDGAMGTMIQRASLSESEYRGERFVSLPIAQKGNNDVLCLTQPQLIKEIHLAYLQAGADIISTNSFNANAISLQEYGTAHIVGELNRAAARLAREACDTFMKTHPHRKCYVAGSMGPTNRSASMSSRVDDPGFRAVTFEQLAAAYREQAAELLDGGADILLIETVFDTLNAKAALFAIQKELTQRGLFGTCKVMLSATVGDASGRTLSGQTLEALVASVSHFPLWSIGLNCSFGADKLTPFVRQLSNIAHCKVSAHPNAGLPDLYGAYNETPEQMAQKVRPYITEGLVDIMGGCCGTTPEHIAAIAQMVQEVHGDRKDTINRVPAATQIPSFSGLDLLELRDPIRFALIGERTNVAGSKKFARLIREEQYEAALEVAREMVRSGAHIIDINMDDPMIDAPQAMVRFLNLLAAEPEVARLPVMLDSSRWEVLEAGLACLQGKSIVNSISLKEGEEVFKARAATIRQYGAAVVVMAFDEQGQATTLARRIAICNRAYHILTEQLHFPPQDIIFDPNVLTIGTGMEEHRTFAVDFIETVRYIKQHLHGALVSGGVSNLSFAFRGNNVVREAMHSAFLTHAIGAGLDMAIVNPSTMVPFEEIPLPLRQAVEDVVLNRDAEATARLTELASHMTDTPDAEGIKNREIWREEPVAQRLAHAVVKGETQWLEGDISEAMAMGYTPMTIIEELLMEGMNRVGQLFGEGKMFLPQVIKSARVMRQAVAALQPRLHEQDGAAGSATDRHKGILATVKGDVHDIGKNIAAVVMECNHYKLIDLGVMVPAEAIVRAAVEHQADFVGVSGLITPSLEEMCLVAQAMEEAGLKIPLLIGGATTSKEYIALRMASKYSGLLLHCPDASTNVGYLSRWFSMEQRSTLVEEMENVYSGLRYARACAASKEANMYSVEEARKHKLALPFSSERLAVPAWLGVREFDIPVAELRELINWNALYALWEVLGGREGLLQQQEQLKCDALSLLNRFITGEWGEVRGVVGFFPANSDGAEGIMLFADEERSKVGHLFEMPRQLQRKPEGTANLSLADFVAPVSMASDYMGLFAVNASPLGIEQQITIWRSKGDEYHAILLRSLCDRLAEATSVWLHHKVQTEWWGYGANTGIRPAFGYPSCPDHAPKADILRLLEAGKQIGLTLTEHYMLQPVSAVCGLYFAHPQARYFNIDK